MISKQLEHSNLVQDITQESKSRSGKSVYDYHLVNPKTGEIKGKINPMKLHIPEILKIVERKEAGESLARIHEDYATLISATSMNETIKKYYAGLLDRVIYQYESYQGFHKNEKGK